MTAGRRGAAPLHADARSPTREVGVVERTWRGIAAPSRAVGVGSRRARRRARLVHHPCRRALCALFPAGLQEFYECESASLSGGHSRVASVDLTNFVAIDKGGSGSGMLAPVVTAAGGSTAAPMRRSGSRTALPAPDSAASSPTRAALGSSARGGAQPPAAATAPVVAAGRKAGPDWLAKEGTPPQRRDRLPKPQQAEKSVRSVALSLVWSATMPPPVVGQPERLKPLAPPALPWQAVRAPRPRAHHLTGRPSGPPSAPRCRSLWSLIKDMVGKDLTRVCLPVYFNEPLSALQARSAGCRASAWPAAFGFWAAACLPARPGLAASAICLLGLKKQSYFSP